VARLLITGAGGLLGANLVLEGLTAGYRVIAVDLGHPVGHPEVESVVADLSQPGEAEKVMRRQQPDWVIHCAAATSVDGCEANPDVAFRLNRDMAGQVALGCQRAGARLAHISTDAVFDGARGGYTENDTPRPVNVYGQSKLEGEWVVAAECPSALIIRTNIYGWNAQSKLSLAEWFLSHLEAGKACPGFTDVLVTPILVTDLAHLLLRLLGEGMEGIHHVAGAECISKYDFGVRLAVNFGFDPDLVLPSTAASVNLRAPRGRNLCLRCTKVERETGVGLPGVDEGLRRLRWQRESGHARALQNLMSTRPQMPREGVES
jgi:dTDP-4-dehydrorhamnose reductase